MGRIDGGGEGSHDERHQTAPGGVERLLRAGDLVRRAGWAMPFILLVLVTLALLGLFHEWLGSTFFDTGGQIA